MRTKTLTPILAGLLGWGAAASPLPVSAQSVPSMSCAQTQAGGTSLCGTLTVNSGSIYPERVVGVSVANSAFIIGANSCTAGLELVNNPCSMSIAFNAAATAAGSVSSAITVTYQICYIDSNNTEICGGTTSKSIPISAFVTPTPIVPTNPVTPPVTVPATAAPVSGGTDVSYLPNCSVNVSAQKFCVVVPL